MIFVHITRLPGVENYYFCNGMAEICTKAVFIYDPIFTFQVNQPEYYLM